MQTQVTDSTPLAALTVGQLKQILSSQRELTPPQPPQPEKKNYVYGLAGIEKLFGVSHATAQTYKNTWLKPAVTQNGRKLIIDADKALELFNSKW